MNPEYPNGTRWQVTDHERRITKLEHFDLAVIVERISNLDKRVDAMTKAMWAVAGSLIVAVITFALSIATGQLH